jgi:hypothetical protein
VIILCVIDDSIECAVVDACVRVCESVSNEWEILCMCVVSDCVWC